MLKTVRYVVSDSIRRYLRQEGLLRTLGIIRRRLFWRVKEYVRNEYLYASYRAMGKKHGPIMPFFEVHLVDHCNLDCAMCTHFSPLAKADEKSFLKLDAFERDMQRMSALFASRAPDVHLLGGEPLLHPGLEDFLPVARAAFPKSRVQIVTNGVLLAAKDAAFWETCRQHRIEIWVTIYPGMEKRFAEARAEGERRGVTVCAYNETVVNGTKITKTLYYNPLDLAGRQAGTRNFVMCGLGGCTQLRGGRLYPCPVAAYVYLFNDYFGCSLPVEEEDSIDIHAAKDADEVLGFLSRAVPFCRFCFFEKQTFGHDWRRSAKDIKEWVA